MKYKTYIEIAEKVGIYRWPGFIGIERRVTKSGIRRFLMAGFSWTDQERRLPGWLRLWHQIEWVRHTTRTQLHVKIPPELWAEDRARLAAKLAGDSGNDFKEERKKALRWTKR